MAVCLFANLPLTLISMSDSRGHSPSTRPVQDADVDMDVDAQGSSSDKKDAKVVIITNLTRNVVEAHLRAIFGFYGIIDKIDLPTYAKCELFFVSV